MILIGKNISCSEIYSFQLKSCSEIYDFNWKEYISLHDDLSFMNDIQAINHYLTFGIYEKRIYKNSNAYKLCIGDKYKATPLDMVNDLIIDCDNIISDLKI